MIIPHELTRRLTERLERMYPSDGYIMSTPEPNQDHQESQPESQPIPDGDQGQQTENETPQIKKPQTMEFNKIGIEPTFLAKFSFNKNFEDQDEDNEAWTMVSKGLTIQMVNIIKSLKDPKNRKKKSPLSKHPWVLRKPYHDCPSLEIPSPPMVDMKKMLSEFSSLVKELKVFGFYPSSEICQVKEGGCHINVDLIGNYPQLEDRVEFSKKIFQYIKNHPEIVWAFLGPLDNKNARVLNAKWETEWDGTSSLGKSSFITFRDDDSDYYYTELRFFSMPKSTAELEFNLKFVKALFKHVSGLSEVPAKTPYAGNDSGKLIRNLLGVFKEIGMNPSGIKKFGKDQNIKDRIAYHQNPKYPIQYKKNLV